MNIHEVNWQVHKLSYGVQNVSADQVHFGVRAEVDKCDTELDS